MKKYVPVLIFALLIFLTYKTLESLDTKPNDPTFRCVDGTKVYEGLKIIVLPSKDTLDFNQIILKDNCKSYLWNGELIMNACKDTEEFGEKRHVTYLKH